MRSDRSPLTLQPVSDDERIPALDVLRGFALFGVLLAYTVWSLGNAPRESYSEINVVLDNALSVLVDSKFYTIFALLFGLGFSIQLQGADAKGCSVVPMYSRRLITLASIGLAHALLLRNGDVLVPYAAMGVFLLVLRRASPKTLLIAGIISVLHPYLMGFAWNISGIPFPELPQTNNVSYFADNFAWVRFWYATAIIFWPTCLPMFFFGLYLGRRRFFNNLESKARTLRFALIIGCVVSALAFSLRIFLAAKLGPSPFARLLWQIHAWGLSASYASTVLLLLRTPRGKRLLAPLGVMGRMALTNYLLQALILVPICLAFSLFDRITPLVAITLTIIVWSFQLVMSMWWMNYFRFGPAEWFWRSLTYGRFMKAGRVETKTAEAIP